MTSDTGIIKGLRMAAEICVTKTFTIRTEVSEASSPSMVMYTAGFDDGARLAVLRVVETLRGDINKAADELERNQPGTPMPG